MRDLVAVLRANAKEPHMTIGGRPFAIEAANEIENWKNIAASAAAATTDMAEQRDLANQRAVAAKAAIERLRAAGDAMAEATMLIRLTPTGAKS